MTLTAVIRRLNVARGKSSRPLWTDPKQGGRTVVPHGFRSSFRDWVQEATDFAAWMAEAQEGTNLIDDAGALPDQSLAHPVQRLQVELIRRLGGDEFHRRALHCLGNRFRVAEIVLLPFAR